MEYFKGFALTLFVLAVLLLPPLPIGWPPCCP
jgi:hypothetical protein